MRIVVASMSRCGSTALFNCLKDQLGNTFQSMYLKKYHPLHFIDNDLNYLIKTHDVCRMGENPETRVIYLYDSPYAVVNSFMSQPEQFKIDGFPNFGKNYISDEVSLVNNDGLGLLNNYLTWVYKSLGIMFIHYNMLFESSDMISEYIGYGIVLPERQPRKTSINIKPSCYAKLDEIISSPEKMLTDG